MGRGVPSAPSPMLREKKGCTTKGLIVPPANAAPFAPPPAVRRSAFSRKNWRCSGKKTLNRVRFTTCRSTSACAKSVFTVASTSEFAVGAQMISPPRSAAVPSRAPALASFVAFVRP